MPQDDIELLQQLIGYGGEQAFSLVPDALKKIIVEQQWLQHQDRNGRPFSSFESFVTTPLWHGLETTIDDLHVFCRKRPDVQRLILQAMEPGRELGANQHSGFDNVKPSKTKGGNSAIYLLKRLKRDRVDLFNEVLGGSKSVHAAAIEAGFCKKAATPFERILTLLPKLTTSERRKLKAKIK